MYPVYDAIVLVTARGAAITALDIRCNANVLDIFRHGGRVMVIDAGAWSVENDGTDDSASSPLAHRIGVGHAGVDTWQQFVRCDIYGRQQRTELTSAFGICTHDNWAGGLLD